MANRWNQENQTRVRNHYKQPNQRNLIILKAYILNKNQNKKQKENIKTQTEMEFKPQQCLVNQLRKLEAQLLIKTIVDLNQTALFWKTVLVTILIMLLNLDNHQGVKLDRFRLEVWIEIKVILADQVGRVS